MAGPLGATVGAPPGQKFHIGFVMPCGCVVRKITPKGDADLDFDDMCKVHQHFMTRGLQPDPRRGVN